MFVPLLRPPGPPEEPTLLIAVRGTAVVLVDGDPTDDEPDDAVFIGVLGGRHCWAIDIDPDWDDRDAADYRDLRRLWGAVDEMTWTLAGRAVQLVEWQRTHRYCGRCAVETESADRDRARRCPKCGLLAFPRLSPAVITLVERDDGRALLARNRNFPPTLYSCLAGFVEPGETLEETVRREVREEVGVAIGAVHYFGSQPWPFPHSLMIGFRAEWDGGDIVVDGDEIAAADWFSPQDLPTVPGRMSIARKLIDDWLERAG